MQDYMKLNVSYWSKQQDMLNFMSEEMMHYLVQMISNLPVFVLLEKCPILLGKRENVLLAQN
jgi:hypothetical protein